MVMQRMLMIVAEDFKKQRLISNIINKRPRDFNSEILYVEETQWRIFATILQRLSGESLVISMHEIELTEYVKIFTGNAAHFENYNSKREFFADLQMLRQIVFVNTLQLFIYVFT